MFLDSSSACSLVHRLYRPYLRSRFQLAILGRAPLKLYWRRLLSITLGKDGPQ